MLFTDEVLKKLKDDDPYIRMQKLCDLYIDVDKELRSNPSDLDSYNKAIGAYGYLLAYAKRLDFSIPHVASEGDRVKNITAIRSFVNQLSSQAEKIYTEKTMHLASEKFDLLFGNEFYYELDQKDIDKIQNLINELRDLITNTDEIPEEQRTRLLKRLEELQVALNQRISNFDKFWGVAVEISGYMGQIGKNVKPVTDRLMEILNIVSKAMKIATGTFLLEAPNEETRQIGPPEN